MKKLLIIITLGLVSSLFLSQNAVAQEEPFITLEYMHVKPGNSNEYLQVENFWRQIHLARQKAGEILGWSVWEVVAPYKSDAPYQYVVLTVYPHFSNFLHADEGIDISKVFPNASRDSLSRMFAKTQEVREMVKRDIFAAEEHAGKTVGDSINYLMATYLKVTPDKEQSFQSFMKDHWIPVINKTVKGGFTTFWWHGDLMFHEGANAPYNYISVVNWGRDNMFDIEPPFGQYQKEDPAAFEGYKWSTRQQRVLLHKVVSLTGPAK
jgi:hypothetical protein